MKLPVLWHFTGSHFNEKARWALDFKGVAHVRRALLPGPHAVKIRPLTGQTAVPVLELNGHVIHDSTRIIEALERAHPDPALYPASETERRRALDLEEFFDEELGPHIRRSVFYDLLGHPDAMVDLFTHETGGVARATYRATFPLLSFVLRKALEIDADTAALSRRKTIAALDRLEAEIQPSGYLVGDCFTVADLTAAALFSPFVDPPEFPYAQPKSLPGPVLAFRESLANRRGFGWVQEIYRRHRGRSAEVGR